MYWLSDVMTGWMRVAFLGFLTKVLNFPALKASVTVTVWCCCFGWVGGGCSMSWVESLCWELPVSPTRLAVTPDFLVETPDLRAPLPPLALQKNNQFVLALVKQQRVVGHVIRTGLEIGPTYGRWTK